MASVTVASCFEIVDEEYIAELKEKIENENTKNSTEESFQKVGEWKKLPSKFKRVWRRFLQPNTVAVLCIEKFSNFALYVINNVIAMDPLKIKD